MKKYLLVLFTVTLILSLVCLGVSADTAFRRFYDEASLISGYEALDISAELDEISAKYNYDVAIIAVDSIDNADPDRAAEQAFDSVGYGRGNNGGVLLFIAMESRDVVVFYDSVLDLDIADSIREAVTPYLTDGDYDEAFVTFISECDYYINGELNGYPFNLGNSLLISVAVGVVIAFIVTAIMKAQLESVAFQRAATNYVTEGSLNVTAANDTYLYSTVVRREKPKSNGSSGSSGSTGSRGSSSGKF